MTKFYNLAPVVVNIESNRLAGPMTLERGHVFTDTGTGLAAEKTPAIVAHFGEHDSEYHFAYVREGAEHIRELEHAPIFAKRIPYHFRDVHKPEGRAEWEAFKAARKAEGLHCHGPVLTEYRGVPEGIVALSSDPKAAHPNQWASIDSGRVFDWFLQAYCSPRSPMSAGDSNTRRGYYLELPEGARALRENWGQCGYCGARHKTPESFCLKCMGSAYLKESELHLTRVLPIALHHPKRAPLTEEEAAPVLQAYRAAQASGQRVKAEKKRAEIESKMESAIASAKLEYHGFKWLLDNGKNTENCIFYSHSGVFCFGWRGDGLSDSVVADILEWISEFPFAYEIKCNGPQYGRKSLKG